MPPFITTLVHLSWNLATWPATWWMDGLIERSYVFNACWES